MKPFFQGLVFGILVMYGYLNYYEKGASIDLLGPFRGWFGGASDNFKQDQKRRNADEALHGFLFQHTPEEKPDKGTAYS
jgi:hypothetical protein